MSVLRTIASVNVNGIRSIHTQQLLKQYLRDQDIDICLLQEVNDRNLSFLSPDYNFHVNIGEKQRGTAIVFRCDLETTQVEVDPTGRILACVCNGWKIVNIYAPSGANLRKDRERFFTQDLIYFLRHVNDDIILGGDFNSVIRTEDQASQCNNYSRACHSLVTDLNLADVWTLLHPNSVQYTFFTRTSQSRIDRFYISRSLQNAIHSVNVTPLVFSDHEGVKIQIAGQPKIRICGKGVWKVNSSILSDKEIKREFHEKYEQIKRRKNRFHSVTEWWLTVAKPGIRNFLKRKSIQRAIEFKNTLEFYYSVLSVLQDKLNTPIRDAETLFQYQEVKMKIRSLQTERMQGTILRSRVQTVSEHEHVSVVHIVKERKNSHMKLIQRLKTEDGMMVRTKSEMLNTCVMHFQKLFSHKPTDCERYLEDQNLAEVPVTMRSAIESDISVEEIRSVISDTSVNRAPGRDGLSYEVYKEIIDICESDLKDVYNEILSGQIQNLSLFTEGIIILIPKSRDAVSLSQFRPITLLNCDNKILMKILSQRLKPCLPEIISPEQTCAVPGRNIVMNLTAIRNIISYFEKHRNKKVAGLIDVDLNKAFDRVSHKFMTKILKIIKLPEKFCKCISLLYNNTYSQVLMNGHLTPAIPIKCGIRQGCPMSMTLFIICLNPLLTILNKSVTGLKIGASKFTLRAYADDITILTQTQEDVQKSESILARYCTASGMIVNVSKSKYLPLGNTREATRLNTNMFLTVDRVRILGVVFCSSISDSSKINWDTIANKVRWQTLENLNRRLNIIQKIWHVNMFVLSRLWYLAQVFLPSAATSQYVEKYIGYYIWKGHQYRISRDQLRLKNERGGLNLVNVALKCKALFIKNLILDFTGEGDKFNNDFLQDLKNKNNINTFPTFMRPSVVQIQGYDQNMMNSNHFYSSKNIYSYLLESINYVPTVTVNNLQIIWSQAWKNIHKFVPIEWREMVYLFVNQALPTAERLFRHGRSVSNVCPKCGQVDTARHRLISCRNCVPIIQWITNFFQRSLKLSPHESSKFLEVQFDFKVEDNQKNNACFWLISGYIYSVFSNENLDLQNFICFLRKKRFSLVKQECYKTRFGKNLFYF